MNTLFSRFLSAFFFSFHLAGIGFLKSSNAQGGTADFPIFGFRESSAERSLESRFLAVPDPKLAEEHLRILTQAPHMAGSPKTRRRLIMWRRNFATPDLRPRSSNTKSG